MLPPLSTTATFLFAILWRSCKSAAKRRRARAFRDLVRVVKVNSHRLGDLILGDLDHARRPRQIRGYRLRVWLPSRQTIGKGSCGRCIDRAPRGEGQRRGRGLGCTHAHDFCLQTQQVSRGDESGDAGPHADAHVHGVQVAYRLEQFQGVGCDPNDEMAME